MHYKYLDINTDYDLLKAFTKRCGSIQYNNNNSIDRLGLNRHNQSNFILGIQDNQIWSFFGCHSMDYKSEYVWRVGYRAVNLQNEINFNRGGGISIALSMLWIKKTYGECRYITTTNTPNKSVEMAGKSHRVDKVFRQKSYLTLLEENYYLNGTYQTIFEVDDKHFINNFNKHKYHHTFEEDVICQ